MKVVVSGASGFLGRNLVARLRADGHGVVRLVRRDTRDDDEVSWHPDRGELDPAVLRHAAVVNLSGAGVGDKRWNDAYRQLIRDSRVGPTRTIATAAALADPPPLVMLNASAVGWYGDTGDRAVDESSPGGEGYFPEVCEAWESATQPATAAGVRVVRLRSGLILAASGGLLKSMLPVFRLGLGGRLGSGRQYMPFISLADWLGAVLFLLDSDVSGPVNLTGPYPQTNREFTTVLSKVLRRPAVLPVPVWALRVALGEFAHEAVTSSRVLPDVLTRAGYRFEHPELRPALEWALRH